jgi:hypothetical protein
MCNLNELCTNNFGGTKLKRNYMWGYANKKRLNTTGLSGLIKKLFKDTLVGVCKIFLLRMTHAAVCVLTLLFRHWLLIHTDISAKWKKFSCFLRITSGFGLIFLFVIITLFK